MLGLGSLGLAHLPLAQRAGLSALTVAVLIGLLLGNTLYPRVEPACRAGAAIAKQLLLRAGIVLFGFRLSVQDISQVGFAGVAMDLIMVASTYVIAVWVGTRWLGVERKTAMLIGAGSAICGAAAVLAAAPVVKAKPEHTTIAIATVVIFGTLSMFLLPWGYSFFQWATGTAIDPGQFGLYIGSTVHEVAQVIAAGEAVAPAAAGTAVITKMLRVMMLAPFLILLALWLARCASRDAESSTISLAPPWFALGFIAVVLFNSLQWLSPALVNGLVVLANVLLATAMVALGLDTKLSAFQQAGFAPMRLALVVWLWLLAGGGLVFWAVVDG